MLPFAFRLAWEGTAVLSNRSALSGRILNVAPWGLLATGVGAILVGYGLLPLRTVPPSPDYPLQTVVGIRGDPRFFWAVGMVTVGWSLVLAGLALRARTRLVWLLAAGAAIALMLFGTASGFQIGRLMIAATVATAVVALGWRRRWVAIGLAATWLLSWLIGTSEGAEGVADPPFGGWLVFARTLYPIALLTLVGFGVGCLIQYLRPGTLTQASTGLGVAGALVVAEGAITGIYASQFEAGSFVFGPAFAFGPALRLTALILAIAVVLVVIGVGLAKRRRWAWIAAWFVVLLDILGTGRSFSNTVDAAIGLVVGGLLLLSRDEVHRTKLARGGGGSP